MATATITESPTTAPAHPRGVFRNRIVLRDIPWAVYEALRAPEANDPIRMTYHNGTLELMAPEYIHEVRTRLLDALVREIAMAFDLPCAVAGSTTFRVRGVERAQGSGREPDTCFYLVHEPQVRGKTTLDLAADPPPDLAVEVDNRADSEWKLPAFAALGVPEVWRHDVRAGTLWFGRLAPEGMYHPIERSVALPMLTRAWVLDVLGRGPEESATRWNRLLRDWIRDELGGN